MLLHCASCEQSSAPSPLKCAPPFGQELEADGAEDMMAFVSQVPAASHCPMQLLMSCDYSASNSTGKHRAGRRPDCMDTCKEDCRWGEGHKAALLLYLSDLVGNVVILQRGRECCDTTAWLGML